MILLAQAAPLTAPVDVSNIIIGVAAFVICTLITVVGYLIVSDRKTIAQAIKDLTFEIKALAEKVGVQNGRLGKVEVRADTMEEDVDALSGHSDRITLLESGVARLVDHDKRNAQQVEEFRKNEIAEMAANKIRAEALRVAEELLMKKNNGR